MNKLALSQLINQLQDAKTIRKQANRLYELAKSNQSLHFNFHPESLPPTANYVLEVIRENYPDLNIPYHSRWRHFEVDGINRVEQMKEAYPSMSSLSWGKMLYELVIISVFLDAGAGKYWSFKEPSTGRNYSRSEGLALASLKLYQDGMLSNHKHEPHRIDAERLIAFTTDELADVFQVDKTNPLEGLEGRVRLLNQLGQVIIQLPNYFGEEGRLGDFYAYVCSLERNNTLSASTLLRSVLHAFGPIWPKRVAIEGVFLGDVWPYQSLKTDEEGSEFIPFHKLSQWLTYSLIEPLEQAGIQITGIDELTGLPEYRNGGLFIDMGVLEIKNKEILQIPQDPGAPLIIEWRGLTIALLDDLAHRIRQSLDLNQEQLPLAKILQGGTWDAGRRIAKQLRSDGSPPIQIISDGTIF
jgi:hypothetical protein